MHGSTSQDHDVDKDHILNKDITSWHRSYWDRTYQDAVKDLLLNKE